VVVGSAHNALARRKRLALSLFTLTMLSTLCLLFVCGMSIYVVCKT